MAIIKHAHTEIDEVYRFDKARSTHFRCTEAAGAFEDARVLDPSCRCWSSSVPAAFSQGRVPLEPRGPTGPHRSSLQFSSVQFSFAHRSTTPDRTLRFHFALALYANKPRRTNRSFHVHYRGTRVSKLAGSIDRRRPVI